MPRSPREDRVSIMFFYRAEAPMIQGLPTSHPEISFLPGLRVDYPSTSRIDGSGSNFAIERVIAFDRTQVKAYETRSEPWRNCVIDFANDPEPGGILDAIIERSGSRGRSKFITVPLASRDLTVGSAYDW